MISEGVVWVGRPAPSQGRKGLCLVSYPYVSCTAAARNVAQSDRTASF